MHGDFERRITYLEEKIKDDEAEVRPILNFWNASKIVGKIFIIIGGMIAGAVAVWSTIGDFFVRHWK